MQTFFFYQADISFVCDATNYSKISDKFTHTHTHTHTHTLEFMHILNKFNFPEPPETSIINKMEYLKDFQNEGCQKRKKR
jgi:hypothetical protein